MGMMGGGQMTGWMGGLGTNGTKMALAMRGRGPEGR